MELILSLTKKENLETYLEHHIDGFIIGSLFSCKYRYSEQEMFDLMKYLKDKNYKVYVSIDNFINVLEHTDLQNYLMELIINDVDGIYFSDLAVLELGNKLKITNILIYDGGSMIMNSLDSKFYLDQGIDSVLLGREMNYEEVKKIVNNLNGIVDLEVFGHFRISTTKRKFLTNYFKEINKDYDYKNKETLSLVEEKRDYKMPIVEDEYGTHIFSDYIFTCFEELLYLKDKIKRGIIDDRFIDKDIIVDALKCFSVYNKDNIKIINDGLKKKYPKENFSSGYFYETLNLVKDGED